MQPPNEGQAKATQDLRITSEPRASPEDATFVREGLALFNVAITGDSYYSPLAIFLRDGRGAVLGVLWATSGEGGSTSHRSG